MTDNATLPLLMTRPRAAAQRFVATLPQTLAGQLTPIYAPLIEIIPTEAPLPDIHPRGVLFTSANGVLHAGHPLDVPAYCVGEATTRAANAAGWSAEQRGETANDLVEALLAAPVPAPLLHLCGRHHIGDVAGRLSASGMRTLQVAVYDQPLRELTDDAQTALRGETPVIVPLFSPRTAKQFAKQAADLEQAQIVAISEAVAQALGEAGVGELTIAQKPTAKAVVACIERIVRRLLG